MLFERLARVEADPRLGVDLAVELFSSGDDEVVRSDDLVADPGHGPAGLGSEVPLENIVGRRRLADALMI